MARIDSRETFKLYVLRKLGAPLLNLILQTQIIDSCSPATTGTTGTTGTTAAPVGETLTNISSGGWANCSNPLAESTMTQLDIAIDDALDYFQNFASDLGNERALLYVVLEQSRTVYDVPPCVVTIDQPMNSGTSYRFDKEESGEAVGLFSLQSQFGPRGVFSYLGAGSYDNLLTYEIAYQYNQLVDLRYSRKLHIDFHELEKKIFITPTPGSGDNGKVLAFMCNIRTPDIHCYNHIWVQRYAVALTMVQIGRNLSMYSGMSLPGGGEFNSAFYWDMGREEKELLEEELTSGKYGNSAQGGFFFTG